MILELVAAAALGLLLVWLALGSSSKPVEWDDSAFDPLEDTPRGRALLAIKELEFDRETGKVGEADFQALRAQLGREAMRHLDQPATDPAPGAEPAVAPVGPRILICASCGPRPERNARFCSSCGSVVAV